jgi:putative transposase
LPEPVERIIRELLQKRFLTKQKRSLAAFHREVAQACKAQSCGCRRATPWPCGSPASIRAKGRRREGQDASRDLQGVAASLLP